MDNIELLISEEQINSRIEEVSREINAEYAGQPIHLVCVLKGGVFFMCELAKRIKGDVSFDFMSVASYGDGTQSSGRIKIIKDLDESIEGKNVIIVEDIIDSGRTLKSLTEMLRMRKPKTLEICTLLNKPDRREINVDVKYICFTIPDRFVVGYGMDYAQKYRNLPYIGVMDTAD